MLDAGVLEKDGRLVRKTFDALPQSLKERFPQDGKIRAFILADKSTSAHGDDISLTQMDIRASQLAKGAIYAGICMLHKVIDVPDNQLAEVKLCGGFGNFIDLQSAARIRLLPKLDSNRISYIG